MIKLGKKKGNLLLFVLLACAGFLGVGTYALNKQVSESPVVEKAEASYGDQGKITIYFAGLESFDKLTGVNIAVNYSWGSATATSTTVDQKAGQYKYQYTTNSNQTTLNAYMTNHNGKDQWFHPTGNGKDTNYSTIDTGGLTLVPGHSYVITWTNWKEHDDPWYHAWFEYTFGEFDLDDPSSSTNQFYVFDPHTKLGDTLANINVYGYGQEATIKPMEWPGTHSGVSAYTLGITPMYTVSLSVSYPYFIMNCGNGQNQTVEITDLASNIGKVLVIEYNHEPGKDRNYYCHWSPATDYTSDYPPSTGYYILGTKTSFHFSDAPKMDNCAGGVGYDVQYISYSATKDEEIRVRGYFDDHEFPAEWGSYNGTGEAFGSANGANFAFSMNIVVDIYARWESSNLKFYVREHVGDKGYYILGDEDFAEDHGSSATPWTFASGLKMNYIGTGEGGANRASYVLTVSTAVEIRVRECLSADCGWVDFGTTYDDDNLKTNGDNVKIKTAGNYTLYVNSGGSSFIIKGIPLDAFCTDFLDVIGGVCKTDGSTSRSTLYSKWSELGTLYGDVLESEKPTIVAIGFNGGSQDGDDAHKVVWIYNYIVTKYGSTNCADFIWGQNVPGRSGAINPFKSFINPFSDDGEDGITPLIIIISSSVAILSITALSVLVIKKKKTNKSL